MSNFHTDAVYALSNAVVCQEETFGRLSEGVFLPSPRYFFESSPLVAPGRDTVHMDSYFRHPLAVFRKLHSGTT